MFYQQEIQSILLDLKAPTLKKLAQKNFNKVKDLLFLLPYRYQNFSDNQQLIAGEFVFLKANIFDIKRLNSRTGQNYYQIQALSKFGELNLLFFNYLPSLKIGADYYFYGKLQLEPQFSLIHPQIIYKNQLTNNRNTHWQALYSSPISNLQCHQIIAELLKIMPEDKNLFPEFPSFKEALFCMHQPLLSEDLNKEGKNNFSQAWKRLIIEEIFQKHYQIKKRFLAHQKIPANKINPAPEKMAQILQNLPFQANEEQLSVWQEIEQDLQNNFPMKRLIQGEVSSGKTLLAYLASALVALNNKQTVFLAPTELLAQQHYKTLQNYGAENVILLTGKEKKALPEIASGEAKIIIATHAAWQKSVKYHDLALIIVDEQHRFGLQQQAELQTKSAYLPHLLLLTATPIPRSLALTNYGDLAISSLRKTVRERKVETRIFPISRKDEIIKKLQNYCGQGKQVYWILPAIDENQNLNNIEATFAEIKALLPSLKIAILHSKINCLEREKIMSDFTHGEIDLLLATTIIEVGIDVKNANLIIIDNAERFGLAQLHQLRGRVGRHGEDAFCILLYKNSISEIAQKRLSFFRENKDSFALAEADLILRGEGEVLGVEQAGNNWLWANFPRDDYLQEYVQEKLKNLDFKDINIQEF